MIYYHGTVKAYLPSILKEGLKPQANVWKAKWPKISGGRPVEATEKKGCIYLAKDKYTAEFFAQCRAVYLKTKPGRTFHYQDSSGTTPLFTKMAEAPVLKTIPIVLEVRLAKDEELEEDPNCTLGGGYGFLYGGTISPASITVLGEKHGL